MTLLLVLMLAGLWGAVFLPSLLRAKRGTSPTVSVSTFSRGMRALAGGRPAGGRWIMTPGAEAPNRKARSQLEFRRKVFQYLLVTAALTLILGLLPGLQAWLWAHLVVDLLLGAFVTYLIRSRPQHKAEVLEFKREEPTLVVVPSDEPDLAGPELPDVVADGSDDEVQEIEAPAQLRLDDDEYLKVGFGI